LPRFLEYLDRLYKGNLGKTPHFGEIDQASGQTRQTTGVLDGNTTLSRDYGAYVHPIMNGNNVHLSVKRTPEFHGHVTQQNASKTRSFKIRKRRLAHSFPLTAFKINISIIFFALQYISQVSNQ
jgi:hypothetical protein